MSDGTADLTVEIQNSQNDAKQTQRSAQRSAREQLISAKRNLSHSVDIVYNLRHTTITRSDSVTAHPSVSDLDETGLQATGGHDLTNRPDHTPAQTPKRTEPNTVENIPDNSAVEGAESPIESAAVEQVELFIDPTSKNPVFIRPQLPVTGSRGPSRGPSPIAPAEIVEGKDIVDDTDSDGDDDSVDIRTSVDSNLLDPNAVDDNLDEQPVGEFAAPQNTSDVSAPVIIISPALIPSAPAASDVESDTQCIFDQPSAETEPSQPPDSSLAHSNVNEQVDGSLPRPLSAELQDELVAKLIELVDRNARSPLFNRLTGILEEALANGAEQVNAPTNDPNTDSGAGQEAEQLIDEDDADPPLPFDFDEELLETAKPVSVNAPAATDSTAPAANSHVSGDADSAQQSTVDIVTVPRSSAPQDQSTDIRAQTNPSTVSPKSGGHLSGAAQKSQALKPQQQSSGRPQQGQIQKQTAEGPFILKPQLYSQPVPPKYTNARDFEADMADGGLSPGQFHGHLGEDGREWVRQLENYCVYRGFDNERSLALMKVLLVGPAGTWFESLDKDAIKGYSELLAAFKTRYMPPAALKFKSAKELYSRKQLDGESVDGYIELMRKLARQVVDDDQQAENMARYAIMNGLKGHISSFVTQKEPSSLSDVIRAARLAELTCNESTEDVSSQIQKLHDKIDRMNAAATTYGDQQVHTPQQASARSYSPSGGRRVSFNDNIDQSGWRRPGAYSPPPAQSYGQQYTQQYAQQRTQPYAQQYVQYAPPYVQPYTQVNGGEQGADNYTQGYAQATQAAYQPAPQQQQSRGSAGRRGGFVGRGNNRGRGGMYQQQVGGQDTCQTPGEFPQPTADQCSKCGRRNHMNQLQCPAINKSCFICQRPGHLSTVCRAAMRGRVGSANGGGPRRGNY